MLDRPSDGMCLEEMCEDNDKMMYDSSMECKAATTSTSATTTNNNNNTNNNQYTHNRQIWSVVDRVRSGLGI